MKSTKQTPKDSPKPYKQKLLLAREMRGRVGGLIYDRVALLCEVFDDADFRADFGNIDDLRAAEILDAEVADVGFDFLQLREIAKNITDRAQWEKRTIFDLWEEIREAAQKRLQLAEPQPRTRRVISQAEYHDVCEQADRYKAVIRQELKPVQTENAVLRKQIKELEARIAELEAENKELRAKLIAPESVLCAV